MTQHAKRGRGSFRLVITSAIAALGLALAGCGGSGGGGGSASTAASPSTAAASAGVSAPGPSATDTAASSAGAGTSAATATSSAASTGASNPLPTAVTLNWMPPTENTDGTALSNLAGYHIHYGTQSGDYTQTITVDNPGIATYVVDNLSPGTYYFVVTAYNSDGTESPLSSEVRATVN